MKASSPFLFFIIRFVVLYGALSIIYNLYLNQNLSLDPITNLVAEIVQKSLPFFGTQATLSFTEMQSAAFVYLTSDIPIVKIIEGCNSISIIILFIAFTFSFYSGFSRTFIFALLGSISIFALNILRIDLFIIGLQHYPEYRSLLHDILFPISIYGFVLLLWLVWVFKISRKKTST